MLRPYKHKLEAFLSITELAARGQLSEVLDAAVALLASDRGTLYRVDKAAGELESVRVYGDDTLKIRVKIGQGLAGWVALAGVPLRINDVLEDDRFDARWDRQSGYHTHSMLAVPLRSVDDRILGVLQFLNKDDGYAPEDERLAVGLAAVCALALQVDGE